MERFSLSGWQTYLVGIGIIKLGHIPSENHECFKSIILKVKRKIPLTAKEIIYRINPVLRG